MYGMYINLSPVCLNNLIFIFQSRKQIRWLEGKEKRRGENI